MSTKSQLPHLIKLLDDHDPIVQAAVQAELWKSDGDVSAEILELGLELTSIEEQTLSKAIAPARRARLERDWFVPENTLKSPEGDWDTFESIMQLISDFMHNGVHSRSLLSDNLDEIAADIEDKYPEPGVNEIIQEIFKSGKLVGNRTDYYSPYNSDLVWVLANGKGNPIALATILMLVARRLKVEIYGCNLPGHFLAQTTNNGLPILIDAFTNGRQIEVNELLTNPQKFSEVARSAIKNPCSLGIILQRTLTNLKVSFEKKGNQVDADLIEKLITSLKGHI